MIWRSWRGISVLVLELRCGVRKLIFNRCIYREYSREYGRRKFVCCDLTFLIPRKSTPLMHFDTAHRRAGLAPQYSVSFRALAFRRFRSCGKYTFSVFTANTRKIRPCQEWFLSNALEFCRPGAMSLPRQYAAVFDGGGVKISLFGIY